jgi:hypothetical protein
MNAESLNAAPDTAGAAMKLPVITATVIAYAILAAAWICYTELVIR